MTAHPAPQDGDELGLTSITEYWPTIPRSKSLIEAIEVLVEADKAAAVREAEQNAVAWAISVLDSLHNLGSYSNEEDRLYKGAKNTIRQRFESETGVDPAPKYPVMAKLFTNDVDRCQTDVADPPHPTSTESGDAQL